MKVFRMRSELFFVTIIGLSLLTSKATAEDVPERSLLAIGLAELQLMSDEAGLLIRGRAASTALTTQTVSIGGVAPTAQNTSNVSSISNAVPAGSQATTTSGSAVFGSLIISPSSATPGFSGFFSGLAGAAAFAPGGTARATGA